MTSAGFPLDLLAATTGWAVFAVFVALCVVLAGFVVRFARHLNRRARDDGHRPPDQPPGPGRPSRR
jgi:hypothetical protein